MKKRIFIGSSSEGLPVARQVAEVLEDHPKVTPLLWNGLFRTGEITFVVIEKIAAEVDGAVFVATPDDTTKSRGRRYDAPRDNVIFEYGYFTSRLTRNRVALCLFDRTRLPTDANHITHIPMGPFKEGATLTKRAENRLRLWVQSLQSLSPSMAATEIVHGFSGRWKLDLQFSLWRDIPLGKGQSCHYSACLFLYVSPDLSAGEGLMAGRLDVRFPECRASFLKSEILTINDRTSGTHLHLDGFMHSRELLEKKGGPPQEDGFEERLHQTREFSMTLGPSLDAGTLEGEFTSTRTGNVCSRGLVRASRTAQILGPFV